MVFFKQNPDLEFRVGVYFKCRTSEVILIDYLRIFNEICFTKAPCEVDV